MKIRTDFVTNSSSSCFCIQLKLKFDNGEKLTLSGSEWEGDWEVRDGCSRAVEKKLPHWRIGCNFSRIVAARDDMEALAEALSGYANKAKMKALSGAEHMTDAVMEMYSCVDGEYSYNGETFTMLGLDQDRWSYNTVEGGVSALREIGMQQFTDKALEKLVLYQDADGWAEFQEQGEKLGIDFDETDKSKKLVCKMNKNGEIDVEIKYYRKH